MTHDAGEPPLPLWTALADLFLDTDVSLLVPHVARAIVASGRSIEEAEHILRWDIRPAFYGNLLQVAGEWAGWDEEHVRARVLAGRRERLSRLIVGRDRFFPRDVWPAVVAEVARLRAHRLGDPAAA